MKKIIISIFIFLALSASAFAQKMYFDIGNTRIKDSTNYTTMNRSVLMNQNLFVRGSVFLDTNGYGKIYYNGYEMAFETIKNGGFLFNNLGENAGVTIWLGEKNSQMTINKNSGGSGMPLVTIDSTGINIESGMTYKIAGVPISGSGSTANLYGYMHQDTAFSHNQHLKTKTFTIYGSGDDSARFSIKGTSSELFIDPVGNSIIFGPNGDLIGSKNVFAGAYYIGDTLLTNKTLTWERQQTFDSVIVNGIAFIDTLRTNILLSRENAATFIFGNSTKNFFIGREDASSYMSVRGTDAGNTIFFLVGGSSLGTMGTTGFSFGDGTTGRPLIRSSAGTTSNVGFGFVGDENTGLLWNSADNISLVTGGTSRLTLSATTTTSTQPLIVSGTSSYFLPPVLTGAQRDALTPSAGMVIYNSDTSKLQVYAGSWIDLH